MTNKRNSLWMFVFLVILTETAWSNQNLNSNIPDNMIFTESHSKELFAIGKIKEFRGVLNRNDIDDRVSRSIDVYEFKDVIQTELTEAFCDKIHRKIFGPLEELPLVKVKNGIATTDSKGKFCYLNFRDENPGALIRERHVHSRIIKHRVLSWVYRYGQTSKVPELGEEQELFQKITDKW